MSFAYVCVVYILSSKLLFKPTMHIPIYTIFTMSYNRGVISSGASNTNNICIHGEIRKQIKEHKQLPFFLKKKKVPWTHENRTFDIKGTVKGW